jgi:MFS family permease
MASFLHVLKNNHNYRYTWMGQVVSEIGDHFNNIAVFSLVLANTHSGLAVSGVMVSRAVPAVLAGPIAGVLLDRLDRKKVMIASDLVRFVVALGFILTVDGHSTASLYLLYALSAVLMFASPFFTSGRSAILPTITTREELHTANSLTQTTAWMTLTIGPSPPAPSSVNWAFKAAFLFNAISFLFSAISISRLRAVTAHSVLPQRHSRRTMWFVPGTNTLRACGTCARIHSSLESPCWGSAGHRAAARRKSCSAFRRAGVQARAGGDRIYLGVRGHRTGLRRRPRALAGTDTQL